MAGRRILGDHWFFRGSLARTIAALLALLASALVPAQAASKKKAIAFVVGVENFDSKDLNTLNYAASDAVQVFHAINAITDLQSKHSQLLLATTKAPADIQGLKDIPSATTVKKQEKLTKSEIEGGLQSFLNNATDLTDTLLFIYFGGHGDVENQAQGMSYLPSNFERVGKNFNYHYPLEDIINLINRKVPGERATIIFMNTCFADGQPGERRDTLKDLFAGKRRYYYPASVSKQQTFESSALSGSFFVRALTDAMYGGAVDSDGYITTKLLNSTVIDNLTLLYDKYAKNMALSPPQAELGANLQFGLPSEVQSQEKGLLGIALSTAALQTNSPARRRMLYRLAGMNFHRAAQLTDNPDQKAEWYFAESSSQVRGFLTRHILPADVGSILPDEIALKAREPIGRALRTAATNLKNTKTQQPLAEKAKAALEVFEREVRYVTVFLTEPEKTTARPDPARSGPTAAEKHKELLDILADNGRTKAADRPVFEVILSENVTELSQGLTNFLTGQIAKDPDKKTILNIIYSGQSRHVGQSRSVGAEDPSVQQTQGAQRQEGQELAPVSSTLLWNIAKAWAERPVNILFDSDYGGIIRRKFPDEFKDRVSLLLTAREDNGKRIRPLDTYNALKRALKNGLTPDKVFDITTLNLRSERNESGESASARSKTGDQPGRAEWVGPQQAPFANEFPQLRTVLELGPQLGWWAYYWGAHGTRLPIIDVQTVMMPAASLRNAENAILYPRQPWRRAVETIERDAQKQIYRDAGNLSFWCTMAAFRLGLLRELATDRASPFETNFANLCGVPGTIAPEQFTPKEDGVAQLRRAVWDVRQKASEEFRKLGTILKKLSEDKQKMGGEKPKVHLVWLAAGEYTSPYIPRLEHVKEDMLAWHEALRKRLGDRLIVHGVDNPGPDQTIADTVRAKLRKVAEASKEHDLIMFLYSGRGATLSDGDAALVPIDAAARINWPSQSPFYLNQKANTPYHSVCELDRATWLRPGPGQDRAGAPELQCLRVEEIAKIAQEANRSLVAIFDTQFGPVPGQLASLLDRYVFPASQPNTEEDKPFPALSAYRKPYPKAAKYPQALMIWLEGRVPNIVGRLGERKVNISTGMLMDALEDTDLGTYQELFSYLLEYPEKKTNRIFSESRFNYEVFEWWEQVRNVREFMRPAVLGEVKRPLFAGGSDIDALVHFAGQEDRSSLNLEIGAELARAHHATAKDDPLVALTTVAALASWADILKEDDRERARKIYDEASAILKTTLADKIRSGGDENNLYMDYLYWAANIYDDDDVGNVDEALKRLTSNMDLTQAPVAIAALYGQFIAELTQKSANRSSDKIDQYKKELVRVRDHYSRAGTEQVRAVLNLLETKIKDLEKEAGAYKKSQKPEDRYVTILDPSASGRR
jgi:hypothetical protein